MCYLPDQHTPERECWYTNMGAIDKDLCTVKSMVAAALLKRLQIVIDW